MKLRNGNEFKPTGIFYITTFVLLIALILANLINKEYSGIYLFLFFISISLSSIMDVILVFINGGGFKK